jgi:tetratricopeptide (TPR) repeat protein
MESTEKPKQGMTVAHLPRRWLAVAAVACLAWTAGLLAGRIGGNAGSRPPDVDNVREIAGLPVPTAAPDLHPQYRALLDEARRVACRVVESFPTDAQAVAVLAQLHNLAHDDAGEVACWQRCLELDRNFLMAYSSLATRAANKGEHQQAEDLLRKAIQVPGASLEFAELLASVLTDEGKFQEAARVLEESLVRHPPTARARVKLGEAYLKFKEFQKAKEQFQKAIRIDGASTHAYHGLAQVSARLGAAQEAEKYRAEVARLKQLENQTGRKQLEESRHQRGDQRAAPQCAAQILTMAASVYRLHHQMDDAEQHLRRAAELSPDDTACRAALADLYGVEGRLEEALATIEELRRIEPRNLMHLRSLGILQGRLGRWDAALKTFRELRTLAPDRAVGYAGLAESYLRTGRELPLAKMLAAKAVGLEPSAWNHFILGVICEQQGDLGGARSALQKAIALDPDNPRYRQLHASMTGKN